MQKDVLKKTAFGDLKNTLSSTPSQKILKPQTQALQSKFNPNKFVAQKKINKIKPIFDPKWQSQVLQPDNLAHSQTKMWMPSNEDINRILWPKIVPEPISPTKRVELPDVFADLAPEPVVSLPPYWDTDIPELDADDLAFISDDQTDARREIHF